MTLRSASVMIQNLMPLERMYAESSRQPSVSARSFSSRSYSSSSPQPPMT